MRTAETVLACCVVGLACFIGGQMSASGELKLWKAPAGNIAEVIVARDGAGVVIEHDDSVGGRSPGRSDADTSTLSDLLNTASKEASRRLRLGSQDTYMDDILASRDSSIVRWHDRLANPVRVFVGSGSSLSNWKPDFIPVVRDAFDTWAGVGIPLRFLFVTDSAGAEVQVRFVDGFDNGTSGRTVWSRDVNYWLVNAEIQLAIHHPGGGEVTPPQMRAIALHEVGHLLGLDHAANPENIMSAHIRARELSEADRATARLVYSVPPGSIKSGQN